jgi:hypothetical protein
MLTALGTLTTSAESNVVSALGTMRKYLNQVRCPPKDLQLTRTRSRARIALDGRQREGRH